MGKEKKTRYKEKKKSGISPFFFIFCIHPCDFVFFFYFCIFFVVFSFTNYPHKKCIALYVINDSVFTAIDTKAIRTRHLSCVRRTRTLSKHLNSPNHLLFLLFGQA